MRPRCRSAPAAYVSPGGAAALRRLSRIASESTEPASSAAKPTAMAASYASRMKGNGDSSPYSARYASLKARSESDSGPAAGAVPCMPFRYSPPIASIKSWLLVPSTKRKWPNRPCSSASRRKTSACWGNAMATSACAPLDGGLL